MTPERSATAREPDPRNRAMAAATRVSSTWLALREPADAAARDTGLVELLEQLQRDGAPGRSAVIHDLGCGTGAMGRWLAPKITGRQHWILYDRDADLVAEASRHLPSSAADGDRVTVATRKRDITTLSVRDLAGASLITASALLDLMTAEEIAGLARRCVDAGCPALLTLSVVGQVELTPADPLDSEIAAAFNAHQRRTVDGRWLLGPEGPAAAAVAFRRLGAGVHLRPSPWRLGVGQAELTAEWLRGWVVAACEQRPDLATQATEYLGRRLSAAASGRLAVAVWHRDVLAVPAARQRER